jgi:6-oxo-cyclohex-1-ene-carbonyl-CoA hydrolase
MRLALTMPECLTKTLESLRRHKLTVWDRNREGNRAWLALNMMTEANAGFRAFNAGEKARREVDFLDLRRRLAEGERWNDAFVDSVQPNVEPRS